MPSETPIRPAKIRGSRGYTLLKKHWNMERLSPRQAIQAKCCDCMGYWIDGKQDCGISDCPLYGYQPYGCMKYPKKKVLRRKGGTRGQVVASGFTNPLNEAGNDPKVGYSTEESW